MSRRGTSTSIHPSWWIDEILYISDGDDDTHEISFVGSSNLSRTINAIRSAYDSEEIEVKLMIRSAPIVLSDDEPESGPSSYEDEDEPMSRLPDILDLLRSDPPAFDSHKSSKVKVKVKVDRKGKGKQKDTLDILEIEETRKRPRSRSPDALVGMGNHYLVEGLSKRVEGRKRARSPVTVSSPLELDWCQLDERSPQKMSKADKASNVDTEMSKAEKEALKADEKKRKQLEKDKAKVSFQLHHKSWQEGRQGGREIIST
jgi:hypothetical protein